MKKFVNEELKKWEKENNIVAYKWSYSDIRGKDGKVLSTTSKREFGITEKKQLIEIPDFKAKEEKEEKPKKK